MEKQQETHTEQAGIWRANEYAEMSFQRIQGETVERSVMDISFPISNFPSGFTYVHTHPTRATLDLYNISYSNYHNTSGDDNETLGKMIDKKGAEEKSFILDESKILVFTRDGKIIDTIERCGY